MRPAPSIAAREGRGSGTFVRAAGRHQGRTPVAGLRTTFGSPIYADHVPDEDALVVQRLRDAGAVILGKTNCPEFAAGGNTFNEVFGRTRNPWEPTKSAGGSTGGGAAALASGMIALAEGTDLGGSLRIPASFCGVVGLRPSPGLVPTHPTDWVWDTLQVTGPMARTAEDVALMLQAMCGPSELSPLTQPVAGRDFVAAVAAGARPGCGSRTVRIRPASASIRTSNACAATPHSGCQRSAPTSRWSEIDLVSGRGRRFWRCAASGSSRRCSRGSTRRIGSAPTSATTSGRAWVSRRGSWRRPKQVRGRCGTVP